MNQDQARVATSTNSGSRPRRTPLEELLQLSASVGRRVEAALQVHHAPSGTFAARVEDRLLHRARQLWSKFKDHPSLGIVLSGAAGLALASAVGAGELLIAISAAYAAFLVLRRHVPADVALEETFEHFDR